MNKLIPVERKTKKRTFLGLLLIALLFLISAAFYLLLVASERYAAFSRTLFMGLTISAFVFIVLFFFGLLAIVFTIMQNRTNPFLRWFIEKTLLLLYPFVLQMGRLMHIAQEKIQRSFIEVNNQLVRARTLELEANELLLLLPHCLQNDQCTYKITRNINNCRRCGRCQLPEILKISSDKNIKVEVVTGGTLARRAIKEHRPRAVVAVACERDLSSGILDSFPLPVIGILNERPQGPCFNTRVDLTALKEAIDYMLNKK